MNLFFLRNIAFFGERQTEWLASVGLSLLCRLARLIMG